MMAKWKCGFSSLCFLLFACATPEEIEARKQAQMKADYDLCVNDYGFKPKSDAARNCMLQLEIARQQRYDYGRYDYPRFHYGYYHYR